MAAYAYSFLDVNATLVGPGVNIQMGAGAAVADDGITIDPVEDKNTMTIGADGKGMHTLNATKACHVVVRCLKDSPLNSKLATAFNVQTSSAANHGQNTITITTNAGDVYTVQQVAFKRVPNNAYAKNANVIEWQFDGVTEDFGLA